MVDAATSPTCHTFSFARLRRHSQPSEMSTDGKKSDSKLWLRVEDKVETMIISLTMMKSRDQIVDLGSRPSTLVVKRSRKVATTILKIVLTVTRKMRTRSDIPGITKFKTTTSVIALQINKELSILMAVVVRVTYQATHLIVAVKRFLMQPQLQSTREFFPL